MKTQKLFALAAAALAFACAPMRTNAINAEPQTTLKVDNQTYFDMTIYVIRGSERIRLGLASASTNSKFVIPRDVLMSATPLRFVADPIASSRASVSEEINVRPGDEVAMQIPPV